MHLVELLFTEFTTEEHSHSEMNQMLELCQPFLNYKRAKTEESLLITLVKNNSNEVALNYLLGSKYDSETRKFFASPS